MKTYNLTLYINGKFAGNSLYESRHKVLISDLANYGVNSDAVFIDNNTVKWKTNLLGIETEYMACRILEP